MENTNLKETQFENEKQRPIIIQQTQQPKTNTMGVIGFVCSLLTLFLFWVPFLGILLETFGFIFSILGLSQQPKGLAIAGLIISLIMMPLALILHFGWEGFISSFS